MIPVEAAARLAGRRGRVLLHSARDDDGCGRRSFVACEPTLTVEARGRSVILRDAGGAPVAFFEADPLTTLERLIAERRPAPDAPEPVAIGYLGYELGRPRTGARVAGDDLPDLWVGLYDAVWCHDATTGRARVRGTPGGRARLARALDAGAARPGGPPRLGALVPDDGAAAYTRRIDRIHDYIAAGDIYQVNLARRHVAAIAEPGDPLALYAALAEASPAPYGGVLELDGAAIVSASPERFLHRAPGSDRLETRPIKGTRRRTGDAARDAALVAELLADPKERAEHLMIVDLERNDLGRVARIGTVKVDRFAYAVELPTLYHMVSRVSCRVSGDAGLADILRATFPGGSITGAPKIRAMEIIDELEPARRGPYTGAFGYLGAAGAIDLAIAIRVAVITAGELRLHVGGGIVSDSTAARELAETEEKAAAWRAALAALAGDRREVREGTR